MFIRTIMLSMIAAAGLGVFLLQAAEGQHTLKGGHLKAKLNCLTCHGKEVPVAPPANSGACMDCHGDFPAMAEATKHLSKNPHQSGKPEASCLPCHKQH